MTAPCLHQVGGGTRRPVNRKRRPATNPLPRTRTEVVRLSAGVNLEHEWKDKCEIRVPAVHAGNYRFNPLNLGGREDTDRGRLHTHKHARRNQAKRGPIPSKTDHPKTLTGAGPTSAKNSARDQEVANEEPFRRTTVGFHFPIVDGQWKPKTPPLVLRSRTAPSRLI